MKSEEFHIKKKRRDGMIILDNGCQDEIYVLYRIFLERSNNSYFPDVNNVVSVSKIAKNYLFYAETGFISIVPKKYVNICRDKKIKARKSDKVAQRELRKKKSKLKN